jgi:hypothetical protein
LPPFVDVVSLQKLVSIPFLSPFSLNLLPFLAVHGGAAMCDAAEMNSRELL